MKFRPALLMIMILATSSVFAAAGRIPTSWRARYDRLEAAFASRKLSSMEQFCASNLVWIQVDGTKKNRSETLAEFVEMFKADKVTVHEKLHGIHYRGNTVALDCEVFTRIAVKGKTDTLVHSWCVDTWKKIGGKWQIIKTQDTKVESSGGQ